MYYVGIDLGTSSVGMALTDESYRLIRKKGKDMWSVRLFDNANPAQDRRKYRVSRRRRSREVARIGLLKEYFADEISKVDKGFYQRMEESKYHKEHKNSGQPYAIFSDKGYTDQEYYKQFPTIFHLRKELTESEEYHDIRLVYLAVLNIFKHRGHFLNTSLGTENLEDMSKLYYDFKDLIPEETEMKFPENVNIQELENILSDREMTKREKVEKIEKAWQLGKRKPELEVIKLLCGLSGRISYIVPREVRGDMEEKLQLSFRDSGYEETLQSLREMLPEEYLAFFEAIKVIHDKGLLIHIMKGCQYISQARVKSYIKHKSDLEKLKLVIKQYIPEEYDNFFRVMGEANYSSYVGTVNSGKEKVRRNRQLKKADRDKKFNSNIKILLNKMPQDDKNVIYLKRELEMEGLLPKQLTFENGVIPNQLHLLELQAILKNAEKHFSFLKESDESGLSIAEKIIQIFKFQIPYYVGPLSISSEKKDNHWAVRKDGGKVLPWNIEDKINLPETREKFIARMVRKCTYMAGENVLPKNSLLYEHFMVLNELNNLKIHGEKLGVELKQKIYKELFLKGKKVTLKKLTEYLVTIGVIKKSEQSEISGIDNEFHQTLTSYRRFYDVLGEDIKLYENQKMAEKIIFWGTVYSNDKKMIREMIEENYKDYLKEEQIKRILGYKWNDWGRLSKNFLEMNGCCKDDGEIGSLIYMLWNKNDNLMEILSDKYTFKEVLEDKSRKTEKLLEEFAYEDLQDSYLSAPVKRMTWQTILMLKEYCQIMGEEPKKIFVEMPRENNEVKKRTVSRQKRLEELYKNCKNEERDWINELESMQEGQFRSKKLYLYYIQKGKCMYSGEDIPFELLFNDNLYDIDHIYPRHYVKDDSLDNNLVLVKKEINNHKQDEYPIDNWIRKQRYELWKNLMEEGFITKEKFNRLTRSWKFTDEELAGFINRQLVETGQATKYVSYLLKELMPKTEVIYVKAGNVSDFRHRTKMLKSRALNDFHHAQDAYLNIVVGNTYDTKFTKNPIRFVKEYQQNREENPYHMDKIFDFNVVRDGKAAWVAGTSGTIKVVKDVMRKNTPVITKYVFEAHGKITDVTMRPAKKTNSENYIPLKARDERLRDISRYGGYTSVSGAYYFLVEHENRGKRVRTLEQMPIYLREQLEKSDEALVQYCKEHLKLIHPVVRKKKILMRSLIKRNGYYCRIAGKTGNQIYVENAMPMILNLAWVYYIKKLENFKEYQRTESQDITIEKNIALYNEIIQKYNSVYKNKINSLEKRLEDKKKEFSELLLKDQVDVLLEVLKATQLQNISIDIKALKLKAAPMQITKTVSSQDEFLLIDQSVTGMYASVIDLKTI